MRIIKGKITWIDVQNPTKKDIEFIRKQHKFHPIILDELLHTSARSRVEPYEKYLFLTYHLPIYDKNMKSSRKGEVDFLITKDKIITVHYEDLEPLNNFWRRLSNDPHFKEQALGEDTGRLLYFQIEEILFFSQRQLRHIEENVSLLTKELFGGEERKLLENISYLKRDILDYRIISMPQAIILDSLKEVGSKFWNNNLKIYFSDLAGDHLKTMQLLDNFKETVDALEQTNSQLLDAKTNQVMQRFTVLAFLTFPMVIINSFFTVPMIDHLVERSVGLFLAVFALTVFITIGMLIFFKKKNWL